MHIQTQQKGRSLRNWMASDTVTLVMDSQAGLLTEGAANGAFLMAVELFPFILAGLQFDFHLH